MNAIVNSLQSRSECVIESAAPDLCLGNAVVSADAGSPETSSSKRGGARPNSGGPRANSGGARPNCGGPQPGSGRPRKIFSAPVYAEPALRWYCVRTEYGAETDVDVAIRNAGFETFYPLLWVPPVAARRSEAGRAIPATSERMIPLLPRYLMVRFDRSLLDWRHICTMRGVERLFSTHPERPIPIPQRDIDALRITLAPNGALYPMAMAVTVGAKRKWTNMVEALKSLQDVAA